MPYDNIDPSMFTLQQQPNFSWQSRLGQVGRNFFGDRDLALALLSNSGPTPYKQSFGQILGNSMLQADQAKQQRQDDAFKRQYMQAQMQALMSRGGSSPFGTVPVDKYTPESLAKFAQTNNYGDLVPVQAPSNDSSDVSTFKYWDSLPPEKQQAMLKLKRNVGSDYAVVDVNGVPTVVYKPAAGGPMVGGGTPLATPLTTPEKQAQGVSNIKREEAKASAIGGSQGNVIAEISKKGANAQTINSLLDIADPLVDTATGSGGGAAVDKLASVFGVAPKGAQAIAQLQVLQAGLMLNQPRMEGPQSDRDVELYRQAAASLGEPTVPRETKKAAIKTIRELQQKYQDRASQQPFYIAPQQPQNSQGWSITPVP